MVNQNQSVIIMSYGVMGGNWGYTACFGSESRTVSAQPNGKGYHIFLEEHRLNLTAGDSSDVNKIDIHMRTVITNQAESMSKKFGAGIENQL